MNVYACEVATGRLRQVTNVVNGAYQPEPSPDGKSLAYVGYTHEGYDIFVMPLDETQLARPAAVRRDPPRAARPSRRPLAAARPSRTTRCSRSLPRAYTVQITPGNFGAGDRS